MTKMYTRAKVIQEAKQAYQVAQEAISIDSSVSREQILVVGDVMSNAPYNTEFIVEIFFKLDLGTMLDPLVDISLAVSKADATYFLETFKKTETLFDHEKLEQSDSDSSVTFSQIGWQPAKRLMRVLELHQLLQTI